WWSTTCWRPAARPRPPPSSPAARAATSPASPSWSSWISWAAAIGCSRPPRARRASTRSSTSPRASSALPESEPAGLHPLLAQVALGLSLGDGVGEALLGEHVAGVDDLLQRLDV